MLGLPIPIPVAIGWIGQLADALDAAHEAGILHRDVKPANVLIGRGERLFLADFGIARMIEAETSLTGTGVVLGTPVYMSPEQAKGQAATAASDRYALAVLSWEILTGHPPFRGESALALMNQHVTAPVPMISGLLAELPSGLDPIFMRALSKDPDTRPSSCRLFALEVAGFHSMGPTSPGPRAPDAPSAVTATRPTVVDPTGDVTLLAAPPRSRRPGLPAIMTGAVAVAAISGGLVFWNRGAAPEGSGAARPPAATRPPLPASPTEPPAASTAPMAPVESPPKTVPRSASFPVAPPRPRIVEVQATSPVPGPTPAADDRAALLASARNRLEQVLHGGGRPTRGDFEFARDAASRAAAMKPHAKIARAVELYAQGGLLYLDGKDDEARQALFEALRVAPKAAESDIRPLRWVARSHGEGAASLSGWEIALTFGDARSEAESLIEEALRNHPNRMRPLLGRAALRRLQGRDEEAIADARRAWEQRPAGVAGNAAAEFLGETYSRKKDFEEAVRWFRLAAAPQNPLTGRAASQAARILRDHLGRPDEATGLFRTACLAGNEAACREAPPLGRAGQPRSAP
jgi:Tfp pilus assembly protein PilF